MINRKTINQYITKNLNSPETTYGSKDRGYAFEISQYPRRTPEGFDDILIGLGSYLVLKDSGAVYQFGTTSEDIEILSADTAEHLFDRMRVAGYSLEPIDMIMES